MELATQSELVQDRDCSAQAQGGDGRGRRSRCGTENKLIQAAYAREEPLGLPVWGQDEAGPFQTAPYPGESWQPAGEPTRQPHEYLREGTAKLLTLFHPADGHVRVKGVTSVTNVVLHQWLKEELSAILADLPTVSVLLSPTENRAAWETWQAGLSNRPTLSAELPPLRMLLVLDNLIGHKTPALVRWFFAHGIMPLYTPLGGSWLNMTESIQRILKRRALAGQYPTTPQEIITWLEATARGWNAAPTPFVWGGKRRDRRRRARDRRRLGGSGACTRRPLHRTTLDTWRATCRMTHWCHRHRRDQTHRLRREGVLSTREPERRRAAADGDADVGRGRLQLAPRETAGRAEQRRCLDHLGGNLRPDQRGHENGDDNVIGSSRL